MLAKYSKHKKNSELVHKKALHVSKQSVLFALTHTQKKSCYDWPFWSCRVLLDFCGSFYLLRSKLRIHLNISLLGNPLKRCFIVGCEQNIQFASFHTQVYKTRLHLLL